jgi:ribosomal protein S18 acetylase RimI-like enzyme
MSLTFRKALPEDAETIAALVNSAYRGEHSKQGWTTEAELLDGRRTDAAEVRQLIDQPGSSILLCLQGREILGSVHIKQVGDHADLGMFVVEPGLQGQGVGKSLLALAEKTARQEWGANRMVMYVITLRHELIAFYQRRGYRQTGDFKPFPVNPAAWTPKVNGLQLEMLEKDLIDAASSPE